MREETEKRVLEEVTKRLGLDPGDTELYRVDKSNGVVMTGITVPAWEASPVMYIDEACKLVEGGKVSLDEVAEELTEVMLEYKDRSVDVKEYFDSLTKDQLLSNLTIQMMSKERNQEIADKVAHVEFLDLIGVFRIEVPERQMWTMMTDAFVEKYELTQEEMEEAAVNHIKEQAIISPLNKDVFVFTIIGGSYGACSMLNADKLRMFAERIGSDLWVIPSSIHEVLAVSKKKISYDEAIKMLKMRNTEIIADNDFLSGNVYQFNRGDDHVTIATA